MLSQQQPMVRPGRRIFLGFVFLAVAVAGIARGQSSAPATSPVTKINREPPKQILPPADGYDAERGSLESQITHLRIS